ncbi:MAG: YbjN domain-containing protein [Alphaproteobacteria bacterium]|nr:YbjN domain-containing protein [Alphaproteobacteria bacterium]
MGASRGGFPGRVAAALALALTGLALIAGPAAAEDKIYARISATEVQRLLTLAGVESVTATDPSGNPIVYAQAGDTKFVVRTFDCAAENGETACQRLQYRAGFDLGHTPSQASMNAFNQTWVFGKAYVTDNGLAAIEYPINLTLGVTEANLVHNFVLWVAILEEFIAHISGEVTS